MIDFYFAGGNTKEVVDIIRNKGGNQLLSQLNERSKIMEWHQYLKSHPECTSKLFIDSGAFSAHTKGKVVNMDDYIKLANEIDSSVAVFAELDSIPGTYGKEHSYQELMEGATKSWENYLYMKDKIPSRDKLIPVFHEGEDVKFLKNMLEYRHSDGTPIKYIGLSSNNMTPTKTKIAWFNECFRIIRNSSNPNVGTHAFGMTIPKVLKSFPFTSADSTQWLKEAAYGRIMVLGKIIVVSDVSVSDPKHIDSLNPHDRQLIIDEVNRLGFDIDELKVDGKKRAAINVISLIEQYKNYKYIGTNDFEMNLF